MRYNVHQSTALKCQSLFNEPQFLVAVSTVGTSDAYLKKKKGYSPWPEMAPVPTQEKKFSPVIDQADSVSCRFIRFGPFFGINSTLKQDAFVLPQ